MPIGNQIQYTDNIASKIISATATASQTTFTIEGGYRVNAIAVYKQGLRLSNGVDFTATDGATVVLTSGATLNDKMVFQIYDDFNIADVSSSPGNFTVNGTLTATNATVTNQSVVGSAVTSNSDGIDVTGVITATSFTGDGTGLTGVASTDYIITSTASTFAAISATSAVVGSAVTLNSDGINLHPTTGIITAFCAKVGSAVTINPSGVDITLGIVTTQSAVVGSAITLNSDGLDTATGVVTATKFVGSGEDLTGIQAGLGTPISSDTTSPLNKLYYTNQIYHVDSTVTADVPESAIVGWTQAPELSISSGADFIVADGDEFVTDILGIGTTGTISALGAGGGRIRADNYLDRSGNGAPTFPNGLQATGVSTFSSNVTIAGTITYDDVTSVDSLGIVTARTGVRITAGGLLVTAGVATVTEGTNLDGFKVEEGKQDGSTGLNGEFDFLLENGHVQRYSAATGGNYFPDFKVSSGTTLSSIMDVGDVVSVTLIVASSSHYCTTGIKIDDSTSNLDIDWVGGAAPSAANGSGFDVYAFTIMKTAATPAYHIIGNTLGAA
tara:strand:+ start:1220 stop:2890 length:1671 start_codon:yes stop_codon:yes gene_type:complete